MPTPMPISAVSRFIPAASSEPKVTTRTRTATITPMNSVAPTVTPVRPERIPTDGDLEAGVPRGGRRGLQGRHAAVLEVLAGHGELDGGQCGVDRRG